MALAVEKSETAKRGSDQTRLPVRTTNTTLPAIGGKPRRERARQDFLPADDTNEPFNSADLTEQMEAVAETDPQNWPRLPGLSRDRIIELESTVEELRRELSARCIQIADLHNVQQRQAAALMVARDAIEDLQRSAVSLQETVTQRENEISAAKQQLQSSAQEKNVLNKKLEETEREAAELLQKLLHLSTALNDKDVAITSAEERAAKLEQELTAKAAQGEIIQQAITQNTTTQEEPAQKPIPAPAPIIEEDQKRHCGELTEQSARFEGLIDRIESMLVLGDEQITSSTRRMQSCPSDAMRSTNPILS